MSVRFYSDDEENDDVEEEGYEERKYLGRDSVIFVIECCKEMFEGDEIEDQPFNRVVSAIHDMMLNKIITSDKDLHGVVFFGTQKHSNLNDFPHVYMWQKFDVPCVQSILELRDMQNVDFNQFSEDFGVASGCQISSVLWTGLNMFSDSPYKLASKTLVLFAWNDYPHFGDDNSTKRAKAKATDLHEHDVDVQVLSFNENFKYENFYKSIVSDPDNNERLENPIDSIENLYSFLMRRVTKQRRLTTVPLRLGKEVELSVGIYTVTRRATRNEAINIDSRTNQAAKLTTELVATNTGEILMPSDIKLMQTWAGRDIVFETEEVKSMRTFGKRGLTVLGFKPRENAIKAWYHVRNAQFIYPDEESVKGSTTLFHALLIKCLEKDVVAICSYSFRSNSPPKCVALLPQAEETDPDTSEQTKPPGFFIIFLPFADDIRHLEIERGLPEPTREQIEAADALTKRLKFPYDPENFDNPALQTHYKNLEAMALDKDQPDPIENHTIPDVDTIERKAGDEIRRFKELVFPAGYDPSKQSRKQKSSPAETMQIDVREYVANNKLGKLTVQGLKDICRSLNIKCGTRKADIIRSIEEHFT